MKYRPAIVKKFLVALLLSSSSHAFGQFYTLQTRNMRLVYYSKDHAYIVPHLARSFENASKFHRKLFHYTPSEEVLVFLQDYDDYGYAGATGLPINYMILGIEPYEYAYETSPTNERINWVMNHELVHVVATDRAASSDDFFRSLFFGKVAPTADDPVSMIYSYLTNPRKYAPRWYHEGIAVFMETWMAGGIGRVLGGYDEMVFRTMVRDSSYFYDFVGLESEGTTIDFQIGANSYLYGTRFVTYLADQYGPEKLLQWFTRTDTSYRYFESQFEHVYEIPLDDEWSRWIAWEHEWQRANLDSVNLYPVTPYRRIFSEPVGAVSRAYYDSSDNRMYVAVNRPGHIAHVAAIDISSGAMDKICDIPTPSLYNVSSISYDQSSRTLFFTTHNTKGWRDIVSVNVDNHETKVLLRNARIGDLAFNKTDKSLWGVQHHNGISRLVRIPQPYTYWQEIYPLKYGLDIFDPDISPDGLSLVASMVEISGRQQLIRMDLDKLLQGETGYEVLYEFENNSPENFVYSPDGKFLFGTTYYSGVSNVVRYNCETKKMDWISNCETGFFRPVPVSGDSLIVFRYAGKGFLPVVIANQTLEDVSAINFLGQEVVEKHPIVKTWKLDPPSPTLINLDSLTVSSGEYNGLGHVRLSSAYPVVQGYKNATAFGMRLNLFDPLLLHNFDFSFSYSPNRSLPPGERIHGMFDYLYWRWTVSAAYNGSDFYDLFGPTKTSRKGYSLSVRYDDNLVDDRPKTLDYSISVSGYGGLERLPDFQNISTSFDRFYTLSARLNYSSMIRSLGAVDYEEGSRWSLNHQSVEVRSIVFPRFYADFDYGFSLPIDHSSIWLRSSLGYSFGGREESFANFYFGGFGNNWVDHFTEKRYREYYSFPGAGLDDIGGTNFGKLLLEWNLPPIRFRRLGFPVVYCNWCRIAFFSSGIMTNIDDPKSKRSLLNYGGQVDFKLVMFSNLESTLSFGYAIATERARPLSKEFMVSLKILR